MPPGQAPAWVRNAWVGLELPLSESHKNNVQMGALGGPPENEGGYSVPSKAALEVLKRKDPKAAKWWEENVPLALMPDFVFSKEVCELV